jgi:hypothetical protein
MKIFNRWVLLLVFAGCLVLFSNSAAQEKSFPSLDAGIDELAFELTSQVAERYFDLDKRPVIKVAVFDFVDSYGSITVGSRYVSDRIRLAFAKSPQFELLLVKDFYPDRIITNKQFSAQEDLRIDIGNRLQAELLIFGTFKMFANAEGVCEVNLWGQKPPYRNWDDLVELKVKEPPPWNLGLTPSGKKFFEKPVWQPESVAENEKSGETELGQVIFLTQPICDDLAFSFQVGSDGMIYDIREKVNTRALDENLRNRTGYVFHSRALSLEALNLTSYVIRNATLTVRMPQGDEDEAISLEPYVITPKSHYYVIPFESAVPKKMDTVPGGVDISHGGIDPFLEGTDTFPGNRETESGVYKNLRFQYIWFSRGASKAPSDIETGKGWKLNKALEDYSFKFPAGKSYIATATFSPAAETQYGTRRVRSEYVARFKFFVEKGENIYVINFAYRQDRPKIFVRRLDVTEGGEVPIKVIKKVREVYRLFGYKQHGE